MARKGWLLLAFCGALHAQGAPAPKPEPVIPEGLQLEPMYFEPTSGDRHGGLGFGYSINYSIPALSARKPPAKKPALRDPSKARIESEFSTVGVDFQARGNVALNQDINPADFLKTGLDFSYQSSRVFRGEVEPGCDMTNPDTVEQCMAAVMSGMRIDAAFTGSLESDQKFDKQAKAYGGKVTVAYVPAPRSAWSTWNPFDWPFRLTRAATGYDSAPRAEPNAFPRFLLAFERVSPDKDPEREAVLGRKEAYNRVNLEMALRVPAARFQKSSVTFEWSWRYYQELNADEAIKAATLDHFRYSSLSLGLDAGWRLTYATGRLPLDRQSDQVWELGYQVKLP